ncbi:MAG: hypothetical protein ACREM3_26160, partial [Candidatus Rokuibacteriota bacterium]
MMGSTLTLIYDGLLPHNVGHNTHWRQRHAVKRLAVRQFGYLFPGYASRIFARVHITRVMGPRQRPLDRDNLAWLCKPVVDALVTCGYLVDDREAWADITYGQDGT